jgi:hypothetical protein
VKFGAFDAWPLNTELLGDDRTIFRVGAFRSLAFHCKILNMHWYFYSILETCITQSFVKNKKSCHLSFSIRLYEYWHEQVKIRKKRWSNPEIKGRNSIFLRHDALQVSGHALFTSTPHVFVLNIFINKTERSIHFYWIHFLNKIVTWLTREYVEI